MVGAEEGLRGKKNGQSSAFRHTVPLCGMAAVICDFERDKDETSLLYSLFAGS